MTGYNWCHGPSCHTNETLDRVRGTKGNKVLRTRKIALNSWNKDSMWRFFCGQSCYDNFANKYIDQVLAIAPMTECQETPIEDPKKTRHNTNYGYSWNQWNIKVDNTRQT